MNSRVWVGWTRRASETCCRSWPAHGAARAGRCGRRDLPAGAPASLAGFPRGGQLHGVFGVGAGEEHHPDGQRDPAGNFVKMSERALRMPRYVRASPKLKRFRETSAWPSRQNTCTVPLPWGSATEYSSTLCGRYVGSLRLRSIRRVLADRTATRRSGGPLTWFSVTRSRADEPDVGVPTACGGQTHPGELSRHDPAVQLLASQGNDRVFDGPLVARADGRAHEPGPSSSSYRLPSAGVVS